MNHHCRTAISVLTLAGTIIAGITALPTVSLADDDAVSVKMFAPAKGDNVGIGGRGWFVDLAINYDAGLASSGFSGFQLTGPGVHNNVAPFPGTFSPGHDERLPGLVVLSSTATVGAGSCQNIANLFNLTGVTNQSTEGAEVWDTWIVGAPLFGVNTDSTLYAAVVSDLNGDGIFNDAPDVVADANGDGMCDARDLKQLHVASNIVRQTFHIAP